MTERGPCLGCDREIPITPTTQREFGLLCPMCACSEYSEQAVATAIRLAAKMGVKKDAKVGKPVWAFRPEGGAP